MKNTSIESIIAQVCQKLGKGVSFAGFDYPKHGKGALERRNVTVGSDLSKVTSGGITWGKTFANGALVAYGSKIYLQGIENNKGVKSIKRFCLDKVEGFKIG